MKTDDDIRDQAERDYYHGASLRDEPRNADKNTRRQWREGWHDADDEYRSRHKDWYGEC